MSRLRILSFCVIFLSSVFMATAFGGDLIGLNRFKCFKGKDYSRAYVEANLVTAKRTRVLIMVTRQGDILECYKLVVGPQGVAEGRFKGAQSWAYNFPEGAEGEDLDLDIFVQPLAGGGSPLPYEVKSLSAEDKSGFRFASVAKR